MTSSSSHWKTQPEAQRLEPCDRLIADKYCYLPSLTWPTGNHKVYRDRGRHGSHRPLTGLGLGQDSAPTISPVVLNIWPILQPLLLRKATAILFESRSITSRYLHFYHAQTWGLSLQKPTCSPQLTAALIFTNTMYGPIQRWYEAARTTRSRTRPDLIQ